MTLVLQIVENDKVVGQLLLAETKFSTGSRGYRANGKVEFQGKRYQVGANVVEIGSKPKPA